MKKKLLRVVVLLVVAGAAYLLRDYLPLESSSESTNDRGSSSATIQAPAAPSKAGRPAPRTDRAEASEGATADGEAEIRAAFKAGRSDVIVAAAGVVSKTLPDDNDGSRHQRFIVRFSNGDTVLIAHNIDLADRVPLERGDRVSFRGEYEWNDRGGVVHWTHHDPRGRHTDGWIEHDGRRYQ